MTKSPEQAGDSWKWDKFTDSSNNEVKLKKVEGHTHAFELEDEPGKGYVTTYEGGDEVWPGSVNSWFGPGERFVSMQQALDYYSEVASLEKSGAKEHPLFTDSGVDQWKKVWEGKHKE